MSESQWIWWGPSGLRHRHAIARAELYSRHPQTGEAPELYRVACGRGISGRKRPHYAEAPIDRCPRCVAAIR